MEPRAVVARRRIVGRQARCAFAWMLVQALTIGQALADQDPGPLQAITIETGRSDEAGVCTISGRGASQQLLVTGQYADGQLRDLTSQVRFVVEHPDRANVDSSGWIAPRIEGRTTVHALGPDGMYATIEIEINSLIEDLPINFPNQVVPVFTKYSCNSGGCHGKSGGQNGFRLSLLGFEPQEDHEHLVHEGRGRRLFPAAPDRSLLLVKASGAQPHGGGARLEVGSPPYRIVRRWIEQGMPYGRPDDPVITGIEVTPRHRVMPRDYSQQLVIVARYSDGSTKDVTRMTQFESNDAEMADVSATGVVRTAQLAGTVAVMTRYQSHVDVFRATVPLGAPIDALPPERNLVDKHVFANLQLVGMPPSDLADDATFLRRLTIDLAGRLPTTDEASSFLENQDPAKRDQAIERLLTSTDYADFFANKWSSVLRNKRSSDVKQTTYAFHGWIRDSLYHNRPYDQFVRDVLTATGPAGVHPPVAWYDAVSDASAQVEDVAQLFLGLRIQCARCHHHPFEKWSQQDYYGVAAFFSQVGRKPSKLVKGKSDIFHRRGVATAKNPKSGQVVKPTGLDGEPLEIAADQDPRRQLADWMAAPENPFFAPALANRYWKHFFGRGLVDPEDDMRVTNPACNPDLLDALAQHFIHSGFDLRDLVRTICQSSTYQLSALPNEYNQTDKQNFSRFYPRRLNAEVLLDAIDQLTESPTKFEGLPLGTRAVQLPDNKFDSYFLTVFGRPQSASACECERSGEANLAQSLHLLNSSEIQTKVSGARVSRLSGDERPHAARLNELFLAAFARNPSADELEIAAAHIEKGGEEVQKAYEDIVWSLVNTKEFLFNH